MAAPGTLTVLFSSAGRRVELLSLFRADAVGLGLTLRVLAADCDPATSAACQAADAAFKVPRLDDPGFVDAMLVLCVREAVGLLIPLHDGELEIYARERARFAERGVQVVVSSPDAVRIARDKGLTAAMLALAGIPAPRTESPDTVLADPEAWRWPLIFKPRCGSASVGVRVVADPAALAVAAGERAGCIVQERLVGHEYTVNMFFDPAGRLRCAIPHQRLEVRAGEVSKGRTERHPELCAIARRIEAALPEARGPLCFQAIVAPAGHVGVFEINARFGGGFPLAHRAGGTFSRWLLEEAHGGPGSAHDQWHEHVTMLRYDAAIFLPPEETSSS